MAETTGVVAVRRLNVRCLVPAEHPQAEHVRARIADTARDALPGALARGLGPLLAGREGLWFVRRLELDFAVDASSDPDAIAREWAQQAVGALLDTDGSNVVRFADESEHLARFLFDAARGRAWDRWYFRTFEGLKLLPDAAALRTAIVADPITGAEALLRLSPSEVEEVITVLGRVESAHVLEALGAVGGAGDAALSCEAAVRAFEVTSARKLPEALVLFVAARRIDPAAHGRALRRACEALADWQRARSAPSPRRGADILVAEVLRGAGFNVAQRARLYIASAPPEAAGVAEAAQATRYTRFGGAFLLLPHLAQLPIARLCADWPDAPGATAPAIMRALVLGAALGGASQWSAFDDPIVRKLAGLGADWDESAMRRWQRSVSQAMCEAFTTGLALWRRQQAGFSDSVLVLVPVRASGGEVVIIADAARGAWLHAALSTGGQLATRDALAALAASEAVVVAPEDIDPELMPGLPSLLEKGICAEDLELLRVPTQYRLAGRLRRAIAIAAQGLLRDFAWRLPGFAYGHVAHLRANFLSLEASVGDGPDRCVVHLGRPPLDLILSMTGAKRREYTISWLEGRKLALYPAS